MWVYIDIPPLSVISRGKLEMKSKSVSIGTSIGITTAEVAARMFSQTGRNKMDYHNCEFKFWCWNVQYYQKCIMYLGADKMGWNVVYCFQ